MLSTFTVLVGLLATANAALYPPPPGKHYLGAWLDYPSAGTDLPVAFNSRLGFNASFFHLAMNFPDRDGTTFPHASLGYLDATLSDAFVYMSVYIRPDPAKNTDADYDRFAKLMAGITAKGRRIFLRYGPEMNGNWMPFGQKPALFKSSWIKMYEAIHKYTDKVAFVWSPNTVSGYPFPGGEFAPAPGSEDFKAMDTNNDNVLDAKDDGYAPFYPGDQYVDYVSLSVYWFGTTYPFHTNQLPPNGIIESFLTTPINFYQTYSVAKNKNMFITESAAAFHVRVLPNYDAPSGNTSTTANPCAGLTPGNEPVGPGEVGMKQAMWRQYITNTTFLNNFKNIIAFGLFEFRKNEECTFRDFGVTLEATVLAAFKADLANSSSLFAWSNYTGVDLKTANVTTDTYLNPNATGNPGGSGGSGGSGGGGSGGNGGNNGVAAGVAISLGMSVMLAAVVAIFGLVL
ncbi:glycoside hydrolase superfamily [Cladochytrium replicatum]|nr:glycoside hydrolase superfamily [Cladochytrium replicatum]